LTASRKAAFSTTEKETPYKDVTNYNNFYEFSTDKYEPAGLAKNFKTRPWTVTIDGDVKKKQVLDVDTIIKMAAPEERIYRHRCVEGWSIVVPWVGFSLSELIKRADPLPKAKFVEFTTLYDPKQMPGQRTAYCSGLMSKVFAWTRPCIPWPCSVSACTARRCRIRTARPLRRDSVEVRIQEREVDRPHPLHRKPAPEHLAAGQLPTSTASIRT
jgi:hypothetical protein